ncbi:MAG: glycosyltransferase 87 family protein [Acidimicrobiales bacterium]
MGDLRKRWGVWAASWPPEAVDAVLYGASAVFAALTAAFSTLSLYRTWGEIAVGPYLLAAAVSALLGQRRGRRRGRPGADPEPDARAAPDADRPRWRAARIWLVVGVLLGATVLPLSIEVALRGQGNASAHVQPEVVVIEQAGQRVAQGENPYHATVSRGHVVSAVPGEPGYEAFFPYLPLMAVFGLPASTNAGTDVTDARILFTLATLVVVAVALALSHGPTEPKIRALQFLSVLPTAALPLATGGDDMPIVAFLLLAMVLAQRRRPGWSGVVLGIVSAMKFTAWPLAALALFSARDPSGRRAPLRMLAGMVVVAVPVVLPFLLRNPRAFFYNVVLFPLGLAGIPSPAASALPGHILVTVFPAIHRALPVALAVLGAAIVARYLVRHPPGTPAEVTSLAGWIMLAAILLAPATRVGYLLYPADFFVWAYLFGREDSAVGRTAVPVGAAVAGH